jgi:biopolymer transport protein TolR
MARTKRKAMSDINVVPYIDVMLVLLIIFMVTAPMLTQGIKVDLPKLESSSVKTEKNQEPIIVSIDSNGAYYLEMSASEGKPLALEVLIGQVQSILEQKPGTSVLLRGDKHVEYGAVVSLMSSLQQAGADGVGLITEDP